LNKKHLTVFALSSFYPDHCAGTETYVLNLSKELNKLGYRVSVIVPAVGQESSEYIFEGIPVYTFSVPLKINSKELNGLETPTGLAEFESLLKKLKPDIFHMHSLSRSLHAVHLKMAAELGIKTVFTAHLGSTFCVKGDLLLFGEAECNGFVENQRCLSCFIKENRKFSKGKSKLTAFFINQFIIKSSIINKWPALNIVSNKIKQLQVLKSYSNQNIAIANWIEAAFKINGLSNTIIIGQGINSGFIDSFNQTQKSNTKTNLIFVGRMHPDKGVHLILDAFENMEKQHFNFTMVTIPFSDEMEYYQSIKNRFNEMGFTNWFENLKQQQVTEKLKEADVLILPSTRNEAAPLVILEAFAKKIPVIGSDYIAIKEMVRHNVNGLLFKNGDANSLKEQLQRLVDEPGLLQSLKQNIGLVRTFKEVAKEHQQLYETLLTGKEKPKGE
jgi:glycosyltransferase involved in cell wall biosynthesis